ncbi:sulfite oxidase [Embleya scabrispora]|uniref:Sulfite oxidase n=1 Tax=Embleya scabrispora TaxID=159449 RepID=A0A1T3P4H9_9ACTN|nr:sulfite oxidase [Embleya scabrispora]OPC84008.1 sulfite oxidase [Embleya scabrispora]
MTSISESAYDRRRLRQLVAGGARADGPGRRDVLKMLAAAGALSVLPTTGAFAAGSAAPGIVKPLPSELFTVRGTNAESNFAALRDTGYLTPVERFFVRNHTSTPQPAARDWRLRLWGSGLRTNVGYDEAITLDLDHLRRLPAHTHTAAIECAGNGRSLYASQQGETVAGTPWTLGAIGVARWRGARLSDVLRRAGLRPDAVDVMPRGLDDPYVGGGIDYGRVRRPLPVAKALDDVLLAYEMNGEPLAPDHGAPVRVVVPSWVGISSIKWVGDIEVSAQPLYSPWNTEFYRMFGPAFPEGGGPPLTRQTLKSAFELPFGARLAAGATHRLTGRSWSGAGGVCRVEVSTDGGVRWRHAHLWDEPRRDGWVRWSVDWRPAGVGPALLLARASDTAGRTQPDRATFNTQGYLFDAVVRHPVTIG